MLVQGAIEGHHDGEGGAAAPPRAPRCVCSGGVHAHALVVVAPTAVCAACPWQGCKWSRQRQQRASLTRTTSQAVVHHAKFLAHQRTHARSTQAGRTQAARRPHAGRPHAGRQHAGTSPSRVGPWMLATHGPTTLHLHEPSPRAPCCFREAMEPGKPRCRVASSAPTSMPSSRAFVAATAMSVPLRGWDGMHSCDAWADVSWQQEQQLQLWVCSCRQLQGAKYMRCTCDLI